VTNLAVNSLGSMLVFGSLYRLGSSHSSRLWRNSKQIFWGSYAIRLITEPRQDDWRA
jgi:hypothetical protein